MAFERPITIKEALDSIGEEAEDRGVRQYALPAIQREFVWGTKQIENLFDSLMQGYTIGSLLFWDVHQSTVDDHKWYDLMTDYHVMDLKHNPELDLRRNTLGLRAIVDGQQRLTALNIGIRGSYTVKKPNKRWSDPTAFTRKFLYLNIEDELEDDESGKRYDFKFMTEQEVASDGGVWKWFKVLDIFNMKRERDVSKYMSENGLRFNIMNEEDSIKRDRMEEMIFELRETVHTKLPICYNLEKGEDHDKVLHMFIRANYFGTPLRYSDLLLSIATAQWKMDARRAVHDSIDGLNKEFNFRFPYEFILKAGLVIADIGDIRFKARNFDSGNMSELEARWDVITGSLRDAVTLAHEFGLSDKSLVSQNALLPVAYWLSARGLTIEELRRVRQSKNRQIIKTWLFRSLLKRGIWGGASDTMLTRLRLEMRGHDGEMFPAEDLWRAATGSSWEDGFSEDEIERLIDLQYGHRNAFAVLSMLYDFVNVTDNTFHIDHVMPTSRLTHKSLEELGIQYDDRMEMRRRTNRLPNLQLLSGTTNQEKSRMLPEEWLRTRYAQSFAEPDRAIAEYIERHDLGELPASVHGFVGWYKVRREAMLSRLREVLSQPPS